MNVYPLVDTRFFVKLLIVYQKHLQMRVKVKWNERELESVSNSNIWLKFDCNWIQIAILSN